MKTLSKDIIKKMLMAVMGTSPDELSCGKCDDEIETFIELKLSGKSPDEAMPLVQDHLDHCKDCYEEYEALLVALQNINAE